MPEYTGQVTHVVLAWIPLWLIPLLPFLGAAVNAVLGVKLQSSRVGGGWAKRWHTGSFLITAIGVGSVALAFALTVASLVQLLVIQDPGQRYLYSHAWQLVRIGSVDVNFAFAMDPLGAVMTLVVTGVGALIHVYATSYMAKDPAYWRFFAYLNLFIFAMLLLVLGDNFVVMFFGWEGVGLCSYLLIGFWWRDYKKATAGTKAFIVNRIGDFGFVCGIALLFWGLGGAWDGARGDYVPSWQARFTSALAEPLAEGEEQERGGTAEHQPGAPAHGTEAAPIPTPTRFEVPTLPERGERKNEPGKTPQARDLRKLEELRAQAGAMGTLSFTSYAGARVYFGVDSIAQLEQLNLPDCRTRPGWNGQGGEPAITTTCYAVSPFVRKSITSGPKDVAIVPGDGATVVGDGDEVASLHVRIVPGRDTVLMPMGPTLTFREIHDQLVISDQDGAPALGKSNLFQKLWPGAWPFRAWGGIALITLACLCFFVGATGKSAQIPLYTWLPDAMAGPTPVSALIHAATMVTAGVYMIARLNFLFSLSTRASGFVALIGMCTALFAATIGFFQYDIKKVLAYSTVSQLGFMFIGAGVGAYWAAIFHLATHAFFKACLFLGSGSVIHGMHAVEHDADAAQDMRKMGGLARVMPWTARTYFIACLAITAAPIPLLAGFWSKDEILWKAFNTANTGSLPGWLFWGGGLIAAFCTSFYMWRSYYLTFTGKHAKKAIAKKVKESPAAMTWVLWALAGLSAVGGVILGASSHLWAQHGEPLLERWLHPTLAHSAARFDHGSLLVEYLLMALSVGGAIAMWSWARRRYGPDRSAHWEEHEREPWVLWRTSKGPVRFDVFKLLHNKYYVDEIYDRSFVAAVHWLRRQLSEVDRWIVDGLVNASGLFTKAAAWVVGLHDQHVVDGAVNAVAEGVLRGGGRLRRVQTGRIQTYVYGILGGILFFAILRYLFL